MFFALVAKGSEGKLLVDKKNISAKETADAKKECGGGTIYKGRCTGEDTYRIENGRLEKVEEQQVTPRGDECRIETRQSQNGSWQIVRTSMTLDMSDPGF